MKRRIGWAAAVSVPSALFCLVACGPARSPAERAAGAAALTERARADFYARRYEDAEALCRKALESAPRDEAASLLLADVYGLMNRPAEGLSLVLAAVDPQGPPRGRAGLARAFAAAGKRDEALRIVARLVPATAASPDGSLAFDLGLIFASLGMREEAFRWLETAAAARAPALRHLRDDPRLDALRGDSRYLDLVKKLDSPPA